MHNPFNIMKETEKYFNLKPGSLIEHDRHKTTMAARSVGMYLLRALNNSSYPEIGEYFDRDHGCAINSCKKVVKILHEDRQHYIARATINLINKLQE